VVRETSSTHSSTDDGIGILLEMIKAHFTMGDSEIGLAWVWLQLILLERKTTP
jgi:hypothetical protein